MRRGTVTVRLKSQVLVHSPRLGLLNLHIQREEDLVLGDDVLGAELLDGLHLVQLVLVLLLQLQGGDHAQKDARGHGVQIAVDEGPDPRHVVLRQHALEGLQVGPEGDVVGREAKRGRQGVERALREHALPALC